MPKQQRGNRPGQRLEVRIIGGLWRSRRISFADQPGLRPTPDRVRETLFNWLQPHLPGLRVLDLFAGSGCLALEALSRGAGSATLVDASAQVVRDLRQSCDLLKAATAEVMQADSLELLRSAPARPYDLVFIDPPYQLDIYDRVCSLLCSSGWLAPGAWVYVEAEQGRQAAVWLAEWQLHRQLQAGNVVASLLRSL